MKLVKCYVSSFGKLKDFTYEFKDGVNTIKQDNGWGKSTLANFIKVMFYGISGNKRSVSENDRIKYRPWNTTEKFGGAVWFIWGDKEYKIERYFGLKESDDSVALFDVATGKAYANTDNLGKRIFEIDEDGFLSTTYFSQKDFEIKSNTTLTAKFNSVCEVQDSESFDKALLKVEEKAKTYKYRGDKGLIPDCKRELFSIDEQMERANNSLEALKRLKSETEILKEQTISLQNETKSLTERVSRAGRAEALAIKKQRYDKLNTEKEKLISDKNSAEQIINGNVVDEKVVLSYQENLRELITLDEKLTSLKSDLHVLESQNTNNNLKNRSILNIVFYVVGILGIIGGIIALSLTGFVSIIAWIDVVLFVLLMVSRLSVDLSSKSKNKKENPYLEIVESKKLELINSEKRACELENDITAFINSFKLGGNYDKHTSLDYILQIFRAYEKILRELKRIDLELSTLEAEKESFNKIDGERESLEQLDSRLKIVQSEYAKKSIELANKQASMKMHEELAYSFPELESKKAELNERVKQYEEDLNVLNLTAKFLKTADENLKIRYRAPLQTSLNKYYKLISDVDKSVQIDVDLNVTIEETGGQRVTDYYSKGYQNLFEICKRFALTDVLFTGEKPFIILDDPFYNLDDKKVEKAIELIKALSNEYQIIYLVCHESRVV